MEITVDSSVLVAALRKDEEHHHKCLALLEKIKDGEHIAIEPYSVLVEVVAAIRRRVGSRDIAAKVKGDLMKIEYLNFFDIDSVAAEKAADIAADIGVRGMDAIVIQTAREQNTFLLSLDEEMMEKAKSVATTKTISELV